MTSLGHSFAVQELDGLGRRPLGLLDQPQLLDVLPPGGRDVPAERVRERPALHLALADRDGLDPGAGLHRGLLDRGALARREPRPAAEQVDPSLGEREPLNGLHPPGRLHQQRDLLLERDVERVLLHRRVPRARLRFDRREPHRLHRQTRRCACDLDGERGGPVDVARHRAARSRRTPSTRRRGRGCRCPGSRSGRCPPSPGCGR